jgi:hypothetical protein
VDAERRTTGREKKKKIAWEKRKSFREDIHNASQTPAGIWKLARWAKTKGNLPPELPVMPTLVSGQRTASTVQEKTELLYEQFYPSTEADLNDVQDITFADSTSARALESANKATIEEVEQAIHRQRAGKAPGIDGVSAEFLKAMGHPMIEAITSLLNACWARRLLSRKVQRG